MSESNQPTTQIFGDFDSHLLAENQCLLIDFSAGLVPQKQFWPNSSLSAKFIADYLGMFFPAGPDDPQKLRQQTEIKDTLRYIVNELLENAVKFSNHRSQIKTQLGLHIHFGRIVVFVKNGTAAENLTNFYDLIEELTTTEPIELYVDRLERNLEVDNRHCSGLGYITILSNYEAQIGWKFEPAPTESGTILVTTMVQLSYDLATWTECLESALSSTQHGN
ncbi:MAG: ATP-binding protein [Cyanobacteria bacterium P01_D01_bin.44]